MLLFGKVSVLNVLISFNNLNYLWYLRMWETFNQIKQAENAYIELEDSFYVTLNYESVQQSEYDF